MKPSYVRMAYLWILNTEGVRVAHSFALMSHCKPGRELLVTVRDKCNRQVVASYRIKDTETLSLTLHRHQSLKIVERNIP